MAANTPLCRVDHRILVTVSGDADKKIVAFQRENTAQATVIRAQKEGAGGTSMIIAALAVDVSLPFGAVTTGRWLYVEVDQEVTIKLNGGTQALKLRPEGAYSAKLAWDGEFTAVTVSNAGTDAALLSYVVAGE